MGELGGCTEAERGQWWVLNMVKSFFLNVPCPPFFSFAAVYISESCCLENIWQVTWFTDSGVCLVITWVLLSHTPGFPDSHRSVELANCTYSFVKIYDTFPPLSPYILHTRYVLINVPTLHSGSVRLMCLTCNGMSVFVIIDCMLQ